MKKLLFALLAAASVFMEAQAQTVWRCGPDGRTYSDVPCQQGKVIETPAPRPAADVEEAHARAQREKQQAQAFERDQQRRERAERHSGLSGFVHAQPAVRSDLKPGAKRLSKHHQEKRPPAADAGIWRAAVPGSRRTKD